MRKNIVTALFALVGCAIGFSLPYVLSWIANALVPTPHPLTYHVTCPHNSKNPMDVQGQGVAWVDRSGWGIIEEKGTRTYFWPGGCTIGK